MVALLCAALAVGQGSAAARDSARIGYVDLAAPGNALPASGELWKRLGELGWVEGGNLEVERRFAEGRADRLPMLMADLVEHNVDVVVTWGSGATAAKHAIKTIPIVAANMIDPVGTGLVASLAHPGGNLTGISLAWDAGMTGKWLALLRESVPRLSTVAVLHNPRSAFSKLMLQQLSSQATALGMQLRSFPCGEGRALQAAFKHAATQAQAILILPDPLMVEHARQIIELLAESRLPDVSGILEIAEFGGLMAYGVDQRAVFRRTAEYVYKILRGVPPDALPIEQPARYLLTINLARARILGLTLPPSLLLRADRVMK
jgi:putative ABC transport system substrate-binding protein